ncbi:hypothetical protein GLOTRDRAFT_138761 [Gloeophyllum trabeum ATCC 11539]|uniref:RRM domain-containing protein n=1 Tax=Gloeophyllum trabeum (strain ATCC 11539 / FP-39264 / Madison 617) TaxID=670483 RepID=S7Q4W3_GLOTA|nr:uncharacterized protein GLOTRDRAFT_138761 [Gloeophyllum trabeum ATCC 11539]EPQ55056.1 hypothetical protein GLOTRDRAFT_138761 [Gloeophyllum trabeum ATCC 11539]
MASLLERISPADGVGPVRSKNTNRASPYNRNGRPPKGNPDEPWQHDLFDTPSASNNKRSLSSRLSTGSVPPPKANFGLADKALKDALGLERGGDISIKGASMRGNVVEVTGLVRGTTAADVEAIFKRCGPITKATVVSSPGQDVTVRLTYKNAPDAQAAVKKFDKQQADGRTLRVEIVGGTNATLGGRLGLAVVDGSVDVLMDTDGPSTNTGSKMRSDSILASDSRATVLVAPPGADPKDYLPSRGGGRGRGGRGRGRRRRGGRGGAGAAMDVD